jgi:hypothetical protein
VTAGLLESTADLLAQPPVSALARTRPGVGPRLVTSGTHPAGTPAADDGPASRGADGTGTDEGPA